MYFFQFLTLFNTIFGAGAVGAASRYGSDSDQKMRLLAAPASARSPKNLLHHSIVPNHNWKTDFYLQTF
jgi:hypothetical protein